MTTAKNVGIPYGQLREKESIGETFFLGSTVNVEKLLPDPNHSERNTDNC